MEKGTMRPVKKVLGWVILILGAGMIIFPVITLALVIKWRILIGIALGILGYLNTRAGTQL